MRDIKNEKPTKNNLDIFQVIKVSLDLIYSFDHFFGDVPITYGLITVKFKLSNLFSSFWYFWPLISAIQAFPAINDRIIKI